VTPAARPAGVGEEVEHHRVLDQGDAGVGADGGVQRPLDLRAGGVAAGVHDAVGGVPALAGEQQPARGVAVEGGAPVDELVQPRRPLGDQGLHRVGLAQPDTGHLGVARVRVGGVGRVEHGGDAPLRPAGGAVVDPHLGHDGDRQARRPGVQGDAQPGDAGADDAHVGRQLPAGCRGGQPGGQAETGGVVRAVNGPARLGRCAAAGSPGTGAEGSPPSSTIRLAPSTCTIRGMETSPRSRPSGRS
jgi:hypothetical protein